MFDFVAVLLCQRSPIEVDALHVTRHEHARGACVRRMLSTSLKVDKTTTCYTVLLPLLLLLFFFSFFFLLKKGESVWQGGGRPAGRPFFYCLMNSRVSVVRSVVPSLVERSLP